MTGEEAVKAALDSAEALAREARMIPGGDRELDAAVQALRSAAYRAGRRWCLLSFRTPPAEFDKRLATPQSVYALNGGW